MYGQYDSWSTYSPFWPGQRREVNVACDVQDVRVNPRFANDVQSLCETLAVMKLPIRVCFIPTRSGLQQMSFQY